MASPPSQSGSAADDDVCWRETAYYYGGARLLRYLARRASDKKRGRDGTKYSKFHPRGYLSHHLAAIEGGVGGGGVEAVRLIEELEPGSHLWWFKTADSAFCEGGVGMLSSSILFFHMTNGSTNPKLKYYDIHISVPNS